MCLQANKNKQASFCQNVFLDLAFWNIHGKTSKLIGDKFMDAEFLSIINTSQIIGLVELHTESTPIIPGFKLIKQKIQKKVHKGPKIAGGLAVFVKYEIDHMVKLVNNNNDDSIWIKIKKEETGEKEDIYIGTVYLSPLKKTDKNSSLESFMEEISFFKTKGIIFTQGDLNAHTSTLPDFLVSDKTVTFGIENYEKHLFRNTEDRKPTNERGVCLLDLCKAYDILIVNGWKMGDLFGNFTSFQWNGSRVVDYVLTPHDDFDWISYFKVGKFRPWLSDHCPLFYNISIKEM